VKKKGEIRRGKPKQTQQEPKEKRLVGPWWVTESIIRWDFLEKKKKRGKVARADSDGKQRGRGGRERVQDIDR